MTRFRKIMVLTLFMCLTLGLNTTLPAYGQEPPPGTIIDGTNVDQYKEYLPEFAVKYIKDGYDGWWEPVSIHVGEKIPLKLSKYQVKGSEQNIGKVKLGTDGLIVNHEYGLPFPDVTIDDPDVARKAMFNKYYVNTADDLLIKKNYLMFKKRSKTGKLIKGEMACGNLRFSNRIFMEPKPELAHNPDKLFQATILKSLIPPATDLRTLLWRYKDLTKNDDLWNYIPTLRRTLRMLSSERANPIHGSVTTWDDTGGFDGQMKDFNFKLLQTKKMLAVVHSDMYADKLPGGTIDSLIPHGPAEPYELVDFWEIEVTPRDNPRYPFPVRVVWLCPDNWKIYYAKTYDKQGNFWKAQIESTGLVPVLKDDPDSMTLSTVRSQTIDFKMFSSSTNYWAVPDYHTGLNPEDFNPGSLQNF
jgi:hypothetical protein